MSHYDTLDVNEDADQDAIKKAFKRKMSKNHPDRNKDDVEAATKKSQEIVAAYSVLSNPDSKEHYDATGQDEEDTFESACIAHILELYQSTLIENRLDVNKNYIRLMLSKIHDEIQSNKSLTNDAVETIAKFRKLEGKIEISDGKNIFQKYLSDQIKELLNGVLALEKDKLRHDRCKEILKGYRFTGQDITSPRKNIFANTTINYTGA